MYEAYDWILGMAEPELGGNRSLVDAVGLNFYPHNQWYLGGPTIPMGHHEYRPLADMLVEMGERYQKPLFIAETGAEGSGRPAWLHYVCDEVREAQRRGTAVEGICLYPITSYPGLGQQPALPRRPAFIDRLGRQPPCLRAVARRARAAAPAVPARARVSAPARCRGTTLTLQASTELRRSDVPPAHSAA